MTSQIVGFLAEDPVGFVGGINRYAYTLGNPVLYTDPNGLYRSAAHVCCQKQRLSICWDQNVPDPVLRSCIETHEQDHIDYITRHTAAPPGQCPSPCAGKPDGTSGFPLTGGSKAEEECSGRERGQSCTPVLPSGLIRRSLCQLREFQVGVQGQTQPHAA